jgi:phage gp29-like protein
MLDKALENIPAEEQQQQSMDMLAPVIEAVQKGASESEVLGLLAEAFPGMDETALTDALHKIMFAADAWGRLYAAAERVG